jgi:hypothetical protein
MADLTRAEARAWETLQEAVQEADMEAFNSVLEELWPELVVPEPDIWFGGVYDMNAHRAAAYWLDANHPDTGFAEAALSAARKRDPYFDSRGRPSRRSPTVTPSPRGVGPSKRWAPEPPFPELLERFEASMGLLLERFFGSLHRSFPGSTNNRIWSVVGRQFEACTASYLLHHLEQGHPDAEAVRDLRRVLERADPNMMERCGGGGRGEEEEGV